MDEIRLDYVVAPPGVADFVTLFYHFRAEVPVFEDTERAGLAQLRFRLSPGGATYRFADGSVQEASDVHVIGPTSGAFQVRASGPIVHVFGAGITPAGWAAMIGIDASAMLNRIIDAADLFGERIYATANALHATEHTPAMVRIGEALVQDLVRQQCGQTVDFMRSVDDWLADSPSPDIDDLVRATGLSRRQVERRCNALYGAPPKLLARKYRALKAAVALVSEGARVDDLIGRGFYDQSHLIREIKQFTGLTPGQMQAEPNLLARITIGGRHALCGQVNPLISGT
ncbi:MAG: AraC family transcriptional regulator [Sphingomonas sp.]|nr:AraC family transcriptional regulator [Sphingomonas sp.]